MSHCPPLDRVAAEGRRARRRRREPSRGFTLVEILVAFTMLALFIAAAFEVYSAGLRATGTAGDYARAQTLARSTLETLAATPMLAPGEQTGALALDAGARIFRWRTTVTDHPLPGLAQGGSDSLAAPLLAVVEVTWQAAGSAEPRRFRLHALLLGSSG